MTGYVAAKTRSLPVMRDAQEYSTQLWRNGGDGAILQYLSQPTVLNFRDAVFAGSIVKLSTVPLERVAIPLSSCSRAARSGVLATVRHIHRVEGFSGFMKGGRVDVVRGGFSRGLTLWLVDATKQTLGLSDAAAGAFAGAVQVVVFHPIDVFQTARRSQIGALDNSAPMESGSECLRKMFLRRGLRGLYPALLPSLIGLSAFNALQFGAREPLQNAMGSPFAAGFIGSIGASALLNWNAVVSATMQRRAVEGAHVEWKQTLIEEYRVGGVNRFYAGFSLKAVQIGASMGLLFGVYESLRSRRV